jgi:hypothetical protein
MEQLGRLFFLLYERSTDRISASRKNAPAPGVRQQKLRGSVQRTKLRSCLDLRACGTSTSALAAVAWNGRPRNLPGRDIQRFTRTETAPFHTLVFAGERRQITVFGLPAIQQQVKTRMRLVLKRCADVFQLVPLFTKSVSSHAG